MTPLFTRHRRLLMPALGLLAASVLSLSLSGCQVAGIGAPDATPTATPLPSATAAPTAAASTPTAAASGSTGGTTGAPTAKQWSQPPAMTIDVNKTYNIAVHTNLGDFTITLLPKEAPLAANNFLFLVRQHYYDNVKFHRIVAGFMIQGGDPTGTGTGGPGYAFAIENPTHLDYTPGIVAMANTGQPNSNGSQFFIMLGDYSGGKLPKTYSIFGKVTAGQSTIDKIAAVPTVDNGQGEKSQPTVNVHIIAATVAP